GDGLAEFNVGVSAKGRLFARFTAMALSPDGTRLATGDPRTDGTTARWGPCAVRICDVATGKQLHKLDAHLIEPAALAVSPAGKPLIHGGRTFRNDVVSVWDVARGTRLHTLPVGGRALAFSRDGRTLATAGFTEPVIRLWETKTWGQRGSLRGHRAGVTALAF